jgi:hypothetical protein
MITLSTSTTVPTVAVPLSTHLEAFVAAATTVDMKGELRTVPVPRLTRMLSEPAVSTLYRPSV